MKSQTLTNVLLVVIAVGTVGNFFQGQAGGQPAQASAGKATPVYLVNGAEGDYFAGPTSRVGFLNDALRVMLVDPNGDPVVLARSQSVYPRDREWVETVVRGLLTPVKGEKEPLIDAFVRTGVMTKREAQAYRLELSRWLTALVSAGSIARSDAEALVKKYDLVRE